MVDNIRTRTVDAKRLMNYCSLLFEKVGVPEDEAFIIANNLVDADLKGIASHGVTRVSGYLNQVRSGGMNPRVQLKVIAESAGTALYDACNSVGAVASYMIMEKTIEKARNTGVAFITVRNSNHYSAAGYFAQLAVKHDMIGFTASNGPSRMAPWGGMQPIFGTSPFAYAIPAGDQLPVIGDMASCVVARGKIILAAKKGESIPPGWALNKAGEDTTNAQEALEGTVLPFGGPKGYAVATMIEALTGILAGSVFTTQIGDTAKDPGHPSCTSHYFGALNIAAFGSVTDFKAAMDRFILSVKAAPKAKGVREIYLPGEIELRMKQQRLQDGIPLDRVIFEDLKREGEACGLQCKL